MRYWPEGIRLTRQGTSRPKRSQSSSVKSTPSRPASAMRCTTALVDPPSAALRRTALAKAGLVRTRDMRRSSRTICTARRPASKASAWRRASTAGMAPLCGRAMPSPSHRLAMVEAVPMVMHEPALRDIAASAAMNSGMLMVPAATASLKRMTSVPEPSMRPS